MDHSFSASGARAGGWRLLRVLFCVWYLGFQPGLSAQTPGANPSQAADAVIVELQTPVEYRKRSATNWLPARLQQRLEIGDYLRTLERGRVAVRFANFGIVRLSDLTTVEVKPPRRTAAQRLFDLKRGLLYFFSRERPGQGAVDTPAAAGAVRGTEFTIRVGDDGVTVLSVLEGEVDLANQAGEVTVKAGAQATVAPGQAPKQTAVLEAFDPAAVQWFLYYPAILDLCDLELDPQTERDLAESLAAYRSGDVLGALAKYPRERIPRTDPERVYWAGLLLAVGQVPQAEALLGAVSDRSPPPATTGRLADALRQLIASVKFQKFERTAPPSLATEWLAESYYQQSQYRLESAREAARNAVAQSIDFGFALVRLAELEFSFGRTEAARNALETGSTLGISARNAQALAIEGFVLAAENKLDSALEAFERALAIDGALGNAWLGRGLVRIRRGHFTEGRQDLETAAALEPNRALFRSYLAKAYEHDFPRVTRWLDLPKAFPGPELERAAREIDLAKRLDPNDPTGWLYSALIRRQQNQINNAVRDLERAVESSDRRSLLRSRLLLDQDRAVRGANLAGVYRDAGMFDVSVRAAARAVSADYANPSAHLFLAGSYDALRDPRQVNLRYETGWFNELLLANLLAPVGGGALSQNISQHEYSKLLEADGFGLSSRTEYSSNGDWFESGSQFGTFGNSSYALDAVHRSQVGYRPNEDLVQQTFYGKAKQQLTPQDSLFLEVIYYDLEAGDVRQYYDPAHANRFLRFREHQDPNVYLGYHRQWAPGSHTLFLAARLDDEVRLRDPAARIPIIRRANGEIVRVADTFEFDQRYRSQFDAWSAELQQLWQRPAHTLVVGGRFQTGEIDTGSILDRDPTLFPANVLTNALDQENSTPLRRASFYAYYHWRLVESLQLLGGLSYDRVTFPRNIDLPPISAGKESRDLVGPKAGFIWTPATDTHVRGMFSRSLGGLYYDQSVRLEPSQLAGFLQSFRSATPESVVGPVAGSRFDTAAFGIDHRFPTETYLGVELEWLRSDAERLRGALDFTAAPSGPTTIREQLDYEEKALSITLNQLAGEHWALGAKYRVSEAEIEARFPDIPTAVYPPADTRLEGTLHRLWLYLLFHHRCGFFAQAETIWTAQSNRGYQPARPGDDFWHLNAYVGYRFPRRQAELAVGLVNITDRDYRLNPLNLHGETPRERTLVVRAAFNF